MKNYVTIILMITFGITDFANNPKYPVNLSENYVKLFEIEFIKEMNSKSLILDLEEKFISLFDKVIKVNAQYSNENGHYYLVFGQKDGVDKIELLKINEEDIVNKIYSYINFTKIKNLDEAKFCSTGLKNPNNSNVCVGSNCKLNTTNCFGIFCGVWNGKECVQQ